MNYLKDIKTFVTSKQVFCGIDIHYSHWNLCFVCDGEVVEKIRIPNNYESLMIRLSKYSQARKVSIVYEAGFSGFWGGENTLYDLVGPVLNAGFIAMTLTF